MATNEVWSLEKVKVCAGSIRVCQYRIQRKIQVGSNEDVVAFLSIHQYHLCRRNINRARWCVSDRFDRTTTDLGFLDVRSCSNPVTPCPQTLRTMAEGIERPDGEGNLRVELLTGSLKGKARQVLLDDVRAGKVCGAIFHWYIRATS